MLVPREAIGAAPAVADRLDRLPFHQLGQIAPGRDAAHLGEADGLAQGHAARESLRFGIQQAIQQFLLAAVKPAVAMAPLEGRLALHRIDHGAIVNFPLASRGGSAGPGVQRGPASAAAPERSPSSGTGASPAAARSRRKPTLQSNRFIW